ncbi:hypothetical protein D3C72_1543770 [compost metagenome]
MNDVGSRNKQTNGLADRNDDFVVDSEKARIFDLVFLAEARTIFFLHQQAVEGERAFTDFIFIGPVPLVARCLDRQVRVLRRRQLRGQKLEGRDRQEQQDDDRTDGPDNFDSGVVAGLGGNRVGALTEFDHHDNQQQEDKESDRNDEPQGIVFKPRDFFHNARRSRLKVRLPIDRLVSVGARSKKQTGKRCHNCISLVFHNMSPQCA